LEKNGVYSSYTLFQQAHTAPYFEDTLFVILGDHGFGTPDQLTEVDLYRFHVPMLIVGPNVVESFGHENSVVGSQVDVVPTIMGRLSDNVQHQCWGRDLLNLSPDDRGFAIIKPSGGNQTTALVEDDRILVKPKGLPSKVYRYRLGEGVDTEFADSTATEVAMNNKLSAFLQTATTSLLNNSAGMLSAPDPTIGEVVSSEERSQQGSTDIVPAFDTQRSSLGP
jgi:phosphoglycerol transferase MdoB-like AlkP superfamily enzyme